MQDLYLVTQGLLCGVLQVVIQKLSESDSAKTGLLEKADPIMQALLGVFQCDTSSVHEEAMLAVGALTYACGQSFTKYMQSFYPVLELGLKNHRVGFPCHKSCDHCDTLFCPETHLHLYGQIAHLSCINAVLLFHNFNTECACCRRWRFA